MRHVERMRLAQDRALLILDIDRGHADVSLPAIATETDRHRLELAARTLARTLLDQPTREYLLALERAQATAGLAELGLDGEPEAGDALDVPETVSRLHQAVTMATAIQNAPLTMGSEAP